MGHAIIAAVRALKSSLLATAGGKGGLTAFQNNDLQARVSVDDVAAPLVFGAQRGLPPAIRAGGVVFRVSMTGPAAELFGISLRCVPSTTS